MEKRKFIYFEDNGVWLGYWEEFPDYMTQGKTIDELRANLREIYKELTSGEIPCVHHVGELEIA